MATDFASEHQTPGNRFRPGPGAIGTRAGLQAGRQPGGGKAPARAKSRSGGGGGGKGLGLPEAAPPPEPEQPADHRHLLVLGQHQNMTDLGHDAPFGIQAINNGEFRRFAPPGWSPFDMFWDV